MLVIAGYRSDVSDVDTVDVLDLSDDDTSSCTIVPDYPLEVRGLFGDLVDGVPKVCGGYDGGYYPNCFDYDPGLNAWVEAPPMMAPRYYAAASVIGDSWFVSGGSVSAARIKMNDNIVRNAIWHYPGRQESCTPPPKSGMATPSVRVLRCPFPPASTARSPSTPRTSSCQTWLALGTPTSWTGTSRSGPSWMPPRMMFTTMGLVAWSPLRTGGRRLW